MDFAQVSIIGGAVITAGTIIGWFFRKCLPFLRKTFRLLDMLIGVPANEKTRQKEVPGLFERLARQDEMLASQDRKLEAQDEVLETIRHEVQYNNGSSIKDSQRRTEENLQELAEKFNGHLATVAAVAASTTVIVNPGSES